MKKTTLYYDFLPHCLDWETLRYRWFGVVWYLREDSLVVVKYRFEDNEETLAKWLSREGWIDAVHTPYKATKLYRTLRIEQACSDWTYHTKMALCMVFKKPWKNVEQGWYIIRSSNSYPFIVTAVERRKYTLWSHHRYICENEQDLNNFISRVNDEWEISLQLRGDKA